MQFKLNFLNRFNNIEAEGCKFLSEGMKIWIKLVQNRIEIWGYALLLFLIYLIIFN